MIAAQSRIVRGPGRPQSRPDNGTRDVIVEAANRQFCAGGFAAAKMVTIARTASVSTRTLYRLFPTKADLFAEVVNSRIDRFMLAFALATPTCSGIEESLERILSAYATMTLSDDAVMITRLVISEAQRFPEIATAFQERAITRTNNVIADWLATQRDKGLINIRDQNETAGMLRGMMMMEPQRAAMLSQAQHLTPEQIDVRAKDTARIFLRGCQRAAVADQEFLVWY